MKKFYLLLLLLGTIAHGTSFVAMAKGDDELEAVSEKALSKMTPKIDEKQVAALLNVALKNPEIREQLKQIATVQATQPGQDVYNAALMGLNLDVMDKVNKLLQRRPEPTLSEQVLGQIKDITWEIAKISLTCAGTAWLVTKILLSIPVFRQVILGVDTLGGVANNLAMSDIALMSETVRTVAVENLPWIFNSTCSGFADWALTLGQCA